MICLLSILAACSPSGKNNIGVENNNDVFRYFKYKGDGSILVSGHRGGKEKGYPENSLEGFQNALSKMPVFFEMDPRLTKDSVIVLMHDDTLGRTTNVSGKLADYTWAELQSVRLKDHEGNITSCKIPTLEEVMIWSKGKTVINLDKVNVPMDMIIDMIKRNKAEQSVMLTIHTGAQARYYRDRLPGIMLSAFSRNNREYEDILISGISLDNMIVYLGQSINKDNERIVKEWRSRGVRCMVSYAPTRDKAGSAEERKKSYAEGIKEHPDIIESDFPVEVWEVLQEK